MAQPSDRNQLCLINSGGADRVRTDDFRLAKAALSQTELRPHGIQYHGIQIPEKELTRASEETGGLR